MKHVPLSYLAILVTFTLLAGCTKTTQVTEAHALSTQKLVGSVQLEEMDCTPSASSAGVAVSLLGTKYSAETDSAGNWSLDSIPAGTYTIQFSKPGFEEHDAWPLQLTGSETDTFSRQIKLARIRNWRITLPPMKVQRGIFIAPTYSDTSFSCADTPHVMDSARNDVSSHANLYWFIGRNPTVNYADNSSWVSFGNGAIIYPNLGNPNEHSGDTLYLVAYAAPCNNEVKNEYYSGDTLKTVYAGLGPPSNVVKIVLP